MSNPTTPSPNLADIAKQELAAIKPGELTTEYQLAKKSGWLGMVAFFLGLLIAVLTPLLPVLAPHAQVYAIVGGIVSVGGIVLNLLSQAGYNAGRAQIKTAALSPVQVVDTGTGTNAAAPKPNA